MMELIRKSDALHAVLHNQGDAAVAAVQEIKAVDAVPVVHGEWTIDGMNEYELSYGCIGYEPRYRCSRCGITTESYLRTEKPIMPEDADFPNYCPNCGVKMNGETEQCNTYSLGKIETPKGAMKQIIAEGERKDGEG